VLLPNGYSSNSKSVLLPRDALVTYAAYFVSTPLTHRSADFFHAFSRIFDGASELFNGVWRSLGPNHGIAGFAWQVPFFIRSKAKTSRAYGAAARFPCNVE
jgi:hypothetical protein